MTRHLIATVEAPAPARHWKDILISDLAMLEWSKDQRLAEAEDRIASLRLQRAGLLDHIDTLVKERKRLRRIVRSLNAQIAQLMEVAL